MVVRSSRFRAATPWLIPGSLPYVTHLDHRVPAAHLHAVPSLPHPDADLSRQDRAEALTWVAYIDGTVTDLVVRARCG